MSFKRLTVVSLSCLAAAALLLVAGWMLVGRGDQSHDAASIQIIAPPESVAEAAPPEAQVSVTDPALGSAPARPDIAVYITGAVVNPGVYSVLPDQRLQHVLELAGGPTSDADLSRVNLAAYVSDATHYKIPSHEEYSHEEYSDDENLQPPPPASGGATGDQAAGNACVAPIDINTATAECLQTLPGIGGVRAGSIVDHREQAGPFNTVGDITAVSGIGDGTYRRIESMITVGDR